MVCRFFFATDCLFERQPRLLPGLRRRPFHPNGWSSHWPHRSGSQPEGRGPGHPTSAPRIHKRVLSGGQGSPPLGAANAAAAGWTDGSARLTEPDDEIKQCQANLSESRQLQKAQRQAATAEREDANHAMPKIIPRRPDSMQMNAVPSKANTSVRGRSKRVAIRWEAKILNKVG